MIRRLRFCMVLLIFAAIIAHQPAWAGKVKPMWLNEITENAHIVFEGECVDIRTGKDPDSGMLATWYTFRVLKGIKGKMEEEFVLKQYGGTDGDITLSIPTVKYEKGERVILFLYGKSRIGFSSAVGMQQGKFSIREYPETGVQYVSNGMPAMLLFEDINRAVPTIDKSGVRLTGMDRLRSDKMELDQFLQEVERLVKEQAEAEKAEK